MYCNKCGKEIEDKAAFCSFCGTQISEMPIQEETGAVHNGETDVDKLKPEILPQDVQEHEAENGESSNTMQSAVTVKKSWFQKFQTALAWILAPILAIFIIEALFFSPDAKSKGIYSRYLPAYSDIHTIGRTFDSFFENPKWKNYKQDGVQYVKFTGNCYFGDQEVEMEIYFAMASNKKTFSCAKVCMNEVEQSLFMQDAFFEKIYEEMEVR